MKLKTTIKKEISSSKNGLAVLSSNKDMGQAEALSLFYKQLFHLKEATDRLSFMISEIHFVLENTPKTRRQA